MSTTEPLPEFMAAIYDECEGIAVPAMETPYEQVEAYRETIRALKARAGRRTNMEAAGLRPRPGAPVVQENNIGTGLSIEGDAAALSRLRADLEEARARADRMADDWGRFCDMMGVAFDTQEAVASWLQTTINNAKHGEREAEATVTRLQAELDNARGLLRSTGDMYDKLKAKHDAALRTEPHDNGK